MVLRVPRSVPDDADPDALPPRRRVFGGHPSPLADPANQERAKKLLADGSTCAAVALALGYHSPAAFSQAFRAKFGVRPSDYAKSQGAPVAPRPEGKRVQRSRKPAHLGDKPLPRFDAKPKAPKKRKKRGS